MRYLLRLNVCLALLAVAATGCAPLAVDLDCLQERLDQATPPLQPSWHVGQTFLSLRPNLQAIEVMLALYGANAVSAGSTMTLHLRESPNSPRDLVAVALDLQGRKHNDLLRFEFPPLHDSRGRSYYFQLEGTPGSRVGVWYATFEAYADGQLYIQDTVQEGDLYFKTYSAYDLPLVADDVLRFVSQFGWPALACVSLLFLMGKLLLRVSFRHADLGAALSLGLAALPLFMLWITTLRLRLNPISVAFVFGLLAIAGIWPVRKLAHLFKRRAGRPWPKLHTIGLGCLCALTLAVRFVQIRGLVLPAWVDSVHHALVSRLIAESGQVPSSYRPFLPIDSFILHFGFYVLIAFESWLSGLEVPQAMLVVGQVLNGLAMLPVYSLVTGLTRRPLAGLVSALVTGLISVMPAYYVSWGRYTQLAGMVVLPGAMWLWVEAIDAAPSDWRKLLVAAVAASGLLLTHYRAFFFFACFAIVHLTIGSCQQNDRSRRGQRPLCALAIGGISLALVAPWVLRLLRHAALPLAILPVRPGSPDAYNAIPWALLEAGYGPLLAKLSGSALVWALFKSAAQALQSAWTEPSIMSQSSRTAIFWVIKELPRRLTRQRIPLAVALWVGLVAFLTNLHIVGLPDIGIINNAAGVIALYLPYAILIGYLIADLAFLLHYLLPRCLKPVYYLALSSLLLTAALRGASQMVTVINPSTILATADDLAAMEWIKDNVPQNARFLINVRPWQRDVFMGTDGGWWIPVLTGRQTTLPPALYRGGAAEYVKRVHDLAQWTTKVDSLDSPEALARLREEGVTHVYLGAKGGHITPRMIGPEHYHLLYLHGPVRIYAFRGQ